MSSVTVAGKDYLVVKSGREQATQVLKLTRWLRNYGPALYNEITSDDEVGKPGLAFIGRIIDALNEDALIDLFGVVVGCPAEVSEQHFDIAVLIESAIAVYEQQPAIRKLIDRFFSDSPSNEGSEESSTQSEQPTDGETS